MDSDDLLKLIKSRRSIRSWSTHPVEDEKIQQILEAGIHAPSAANCQKTRFHVVTARRLVASICRNTSPWFQNTYPPVVIVVLFDLAKPNPQHLNVNKPHHAWKRFIWQDTSAAMMNMMLMAEALGLKTCWVSVIPHILGSQARNIRGLLNLPSRYLLTCFLFVGYSDEKVDVNTFRHSGLPIKRDMKECVLEHF